MGAVAVPAATEKRRKSRRAISMETPRHLQVVFKESSTGTKEATLIPKPVPAGLRVRSLSFQRSEYSGAPRQPRSLFCRSKPQVARSSRENSRIYESSRAAARGIVATSVEKPRHLSKCRHFLQRSRS